MANNLVEIAGGEFLMGTDDPVGYRQDGEQPARLAVVEPYKIQATCVTNAEFARFVDATGYVTDSEHYGWSFVFEGLLDDTTIGSPAVVSTPWWRQVRGATWRSPEGPTSDVFSTGDDGKDRSHHPVVHVSWADANRYCEWAGARLPSEAEWEFAARGGLVQATFPWGSELVPDGSHRCNIWHGTFPTDNTMDDGWFGTAPVTAFPPNDYGLYNTVGNVWEWCADPFTRTPGEGSMCCSASSTAQGEGVQRVMKGGSYLCHESYCYRYRVAARSSNATDAAAGNIGFRIAA